jgi:hypothetical protein
MPRLVLVVIALTGCAPTTAVVDGKTVPRQTLGYTDHRFFAVEHRNAYPEVRGPSSGLRSYGGRIAGRVCAVDVDVHSQYRGQSLEVSGFVLSAQPKGFPPARTMAIHVDVRDHADGRVIRGSVGDRVFPIELRMQPQAIVGVIGPRHFQLDQPAPDEDELRGTVRLPTWWGDAELPFVVRGVRELWAMPAADQAVLMPLMMSCLQGMGGPAHQWDPVLGVDFSDRATASR